MRRVTTIGFQLVATGRVTAPSRGGYAYPLKGRSAEQAARDETESRGWATRQTGFDSTTDTMKGAGLGGAGIGGTVAYTRSKESCERAHAACREPCGYHVR